MDQRGREKAADIVEERVAPLTVHYIRSFQEGGDVRRQNFTNRLSPVAMVVKPCLAVPLKGFSRFARVDPPVFKNLVVELNAPIDIHTVGWADCEREMCKREMCGHRGF